MTEKKKRIIPTKPGLLVPDPRKGPGVFYPQEGIVAVPTLYDKKRLRDGSVRFEEVNEDADGAVGIVVSHGSKHQSSSSKEADRPEALPSPLAKRHLQNGEK